jgi:2,3-bisphosphoglycerate-independent phosphoglycerate mutase
MRCILVILDGLGDRGQDCFEGRTPLYVAYTPNLDYLAAVGMNGLYHSFLQGVPMSSETAHFLIFGYDVEEFPGRGYMEAKGKEITVGEKDVAVLCHLCSVDKRGENLILQYGCPDLGDEEGRLLKESIQGFQKNGIHFDLVHSQGIHGFLLLKGNVSEKITDSDPIYEGRAVIRVLPVQQKRITQSSKNTALALNEYLKWCYNVLSDHEINKKRRAENLLPMNALVTQRAGKKKSLMPFREKWGMKGLSISSGPVYWGLCREVGMDLMKVRDTGNVEEDLKYRLRIAKDAYDHDFIHVHTKMPDEAGHTKNPWYKKDVIEAIDRAMSVAVNEIIPDREILLVITADHSTASSGVMIHTGEPVPLTMIGKYIRKDDVTHYNEISCSKGGLGLVKGKELMYLILNFLDRSKLYGLMDTTIDQPYYPGDYTPLKL